MGIFFLLNIGLLTLSKGIVYSLLGHYRQRGFNFRNVLIVGSKERAKDVIGALKDHIGSGFRVLGCLETDKDDIGKDVINGVKIIGTVDSLKKMLWKEVIDEIIFAMPLKRVENAPQYIAEAEGMGVTVRIVPDWQIHKLMYHPEIANIKFEEFLGLPTLALTSTPPNQGELLIKSVFDYIFASIALILSLPIFSFVGAGLKLASRGPIFFKQERCGLNGRKFMVYKFRTMVPDAEARHKELEQMDEADGPVFKIKDDPRIIPFVGKLLRKVSLDELPQFINVLKGEMSSVGPRPPIPAEVDEYSLRDRRRLSMKPGLTCLWQIMPNRNEIGFDEWMKLDLRYIDNWSLALDFKILFKTVWVVLKGEGR